ncbi:hypothetical protein N7534_007303 [Penicillium rubens]|nr:hypothetical protein N7534_007303 [Penicillium rubens]
MQQPTAIKSLLIFEKKYEWYTPYSPTSRSQSPSYSTSLSGNIRDAGSLEAFSYGRGKWVLLIVSEE